MATKFVSNLPFVKEYKRADLFVKALLTFMMGLIIAPLSHSFLWFFIYLIVFEVAWAYYAGFDFYTRIVMITASLVGWVLGRILVNLDPLGDARDVIRGLAD